jgi:hypothetical protein
MPDHYHNAWEIYDAATNADVNAVSARVEGVRSDLNGLHEQVQEQERQIDTLRAELRERQGQE